MSGVAQQRLAQERKSWRKDHPFGFVAKPRTLPDGSVDMLRWDCRIPGKKDTIWEGGMYPLQLIFSTDYPSSPPLAKFPKGFFHPNIYDCGKVCLSIINPERGWKPSVTVKQILVGIRDLLNEPNNSDPAQAYGYDVYKNKRKKYERLVKEQAKKYADTDENCVVNA